MNFFCKALFCALVFVTGMSMRTTFTQLVPRSLTNIGEPFVIVTKSISNNSEVDILVADHETRNDNHIQKQTENHFSSSSSTQAEAYSAQGHDDTSAAEEQHEGKKKEIDESAFVNETAAEPEQPLPEAVQFALQHSSLSLWPWVDMDWVGNGMYVDSIDVGFSSSNCCSQYLLGLIIKLFSNRY
jgi:hypothetical protein